MWPFDISLDPFAGFYDILIAGILILAGILALSFAPGRLLKLIIGGGLLIAGIAMILGYWSV